MVRLFCECPGLFFLTRAKLELIIPHNFTSGFNFVKLSLKLRSIPQLLKWMPLSFFDTATGALISSLPVTTVNCCDCPFAGGLTIAISGPASLCPETGGFTLVLAGRLWRVVFCWSPLLGGMHACSSSFLFFFWLFLPFFHLRSY